jgi:cbb3-type cytochrome oxidase subunit 1
MASDLLSWINFLGMAIYHFTGCAITLTLGYHHLCKEYAELEWPIDILAIAVVWCGSCLV